MDEKLVVGIADMKMACNSGTLITYALGSCIGICLYDPLLRQAALSHILLPLNMETGRKNPLKYADTAIRETIRQMELQGASRTRMVAKIAGGAKMFTGKGSYASIGEQNLTSVQQVLKREKIRLQSADVGGTHARTVLFDVSNGMVCVRSYGREDVIL